MPAPSRRNVGESLAAKISGPSNTYLGQRDRLVDSRRRAASKWEDATVRLSPVEQAIELTAHERRDAKKAQQKAEMKARREVQAIEQSRSASKTAFSRTLDAGCREHDAEPGQPCWEFPRGLCDARVRRAGYIGRVSSASGARR